MASSRFLKVQGCIVLLLEVRVELGRNGGAKWRPDVEAEEWRVTISRCRKPGGRAAVRLVVTDHAPLVDEPFLMELEDAITFSSSLLSARGISP